MPNRHEELVARRAGFRCEYCHLPAAFSQLRFVCDHIVARKHEGADVPENLAFACPHCNSHKLDNIAGLEPSLARTDTFVQSA
jgi:5-methylcytosine-specific restriction endonuclease McrA